MNGGLLNPDTICYLNAFLQCIRIINSVDKGNVSNTSLISLLKSMDLQGVSDPVPFAMTLPVPFRPGYGQQDVLELMNVFFSSTSPLMLPSVSIAVQRRTVCGLCMTTSEIMSNDPFISMTPLAKTVTHLIQMASAATPAIGWKCPHCGQAEATTNEVFRPQGNFVLLHLKRFVSTHGPKGFRALKIIDPVTVTREITISNVAFSLEAVVLHIGDMVGGHYVTDVLARRLCYDDHKVYTIPASRPALATPVLLLYRRL